jgi:hypothetical protein
LSKISNILNLVTPFYKQNLKFKKEELEIIKKKKEAIISSFISNVSL